MRIGDTVRMRPDAGLEDFLGAAADLAGVVGDVWTDERGERISVIYQDARVYAYRVSANEFEPAASEALPPA